MKTGLMIATLALCVAATAAQAACKDELAGLANQTHNDSRAAIAHTSGGQAVAAEREAKPADSQDAPKPAPSGSAADHAMQAKVSLNDAHVALDKGDEAGCMAAVTKAKAEMAK